MTWTHIIFAIVALMVIYAFYWSGNADKRARKKQEALEKKERWGEIIQESESGESWDLARWVEDCQTDSRPFLEGLGFKILGIANEMILWVEPPAGWKMVPASHPLWTNIFDENGNLGNIEKQYDVDFNVRSDMKLGKFLKDNGIPSLSKALKQVDKIQKRKTR